VRPSQQQCPATAVAAVMRCSLHTRMRFAPCLAPGLDRARSGPCVIPLMRCVHALRQAAGCSRRPMRWRRRTSSSPWCLRSRSGPGHACLCTKEGVLCTQAQELQGFSWVQADGIRGRQSRLDGVATVPGSAWLSVQCGHCLCFLQYPGHTQASLGCLQSARSRAVGNNSAPHVACSRFSIS